MNTEAIIQDIRSQLESVEFVDKVSFIDETAKIAQELEKSTESTQES